MAIKRRPVSAPSKPVKKAKNTQKRPQNFANTPIVTLARKSVLVGGWLGWLGPLLATLLAALLRLPRLGTPHALVFDETYYAKDSLSLLYYGYERATIPSPEPSILANTGHAHLDIFTADPAFIVHPPVGKWIIAFGESLFGMTPVGWRIMGALLAISCVLIIGRVTRRLLNSNVAGTLAALFLALDGVHIAMSRTALLDTILTFFVLAAFGFLIIDRDLRDAPEFDVRKAIWARVGLTAMLGLACGTKWSGAYFAGAFLILMAGWDIARRTEFRIGDRLTAWLRDDILSMVLIPVGILTIYITSWTGWLLSDNAYDRKWATSASSFNFIPSALRSLWHYHVEMLNFHTSLQTPHNYRANPWGWPLILRPTSFFYEGKPTCGGSACSQEVIPLGNPLIWWGGAIALIALIALVVMRTHKAALPILVGFVAGWVPWLPFAYRTTFQFYSVVFLPFTIMALVLCLQLLDQKFGFVRLSERRIITFHDETQDGWGLPSIISLLIVGLLSAYFYPLLVAWSIGYQDWIDHMWFKSWI